jgi:hypothetical protein
MISTDANPKWALAQYFVYGAVLTMASRWHDIMGFKEGDPVSEWIDVLPEYLPRLLTERSRIASCLGGEKATLQCQLRCGTWVQVEVRGSLPRSFEAVFD